MHIFFISYLYRSNRRSFIRWCMSADPGYRPDLSDILSYFAYSPAFLTPCIDAPISSVVHEDTDSMGDDTRVSHTISKLPLIVSSSAIHPTLSAVPAVSSSMSKASSVSNSFSLQTHSMPETVVKTETARGTANHSGRWSLTRLKLHSTGAADDDEYEGNSWPSGELKERKKTFSMPGLFFSLNKPSRSVAAQQRAVTETNKVKNVAPVSPSRSCSPCSEALHTNNICGLNACVEAANDIRRRHSVGPDNSKSGDCIHNDSNETNSIIFQISCSDKDDNMQESSDDGHFNHIWPQSSSAPESIICDADVEIHCLNPKMTLRSDTQKLGVRQYSSSPFATVYFEKGEVHSSGYISENSKGDMNQICQTITSL